MIGARRALPGRAFREEVAVSQRALILAGGGLKVGFQAGVLQVWLDEAGLTFDHADGASGGCFNLVMYCQGMSGTAIADNWRTLDPFLPVGLNLDEYWKFLGARSLFTYDRFRSHVLPFWGIDWAKVRSGRLGTFNIFNFSKKRLDVVTNDQMTEDHLIASVSLPMWFPPVQIDGDTYIDSVYISDANVEEAIRRGADEIWAIWTVSTRDEWQRRLRRAVLPDHRDDRRHQLLRHLGPHRREQRGRSRPGRPASSAATSSCKLLAGRSAGALPLQLLEGSDGRVGEPRRAGRAAVVPGRTTCRSRIPARRCRRRRRRARRRCSSPSR